MAQSFHIRLQTSVAMEALVHLEVDDLPDLVALFREHFGSPNQEQQQDLLDFEAGLVDFEALYSKYWNEDGSWKEEVDDLKEYLEALSVDEDNSNQTSTNPSTSQPQKIQAPPTYH